MQLEHLASQAFHFPTLPCGQVPSLPPAQLLVEEPQVTLLGDKDVDHAPDRVIIEDKGFKSSQLQCLILLGGRLHHPVNMRGKQGEPLNRLPLWGCLLSHNLSSRVFCPV